ncbi:MAG TPA: hypothetical protein VFO10_16875 [Oligoflexus sp.]|uniref:hypothetical protein n=1 Tax=Oligoflexus sp. TaxID=1971216 RepID=UPI002D7ED461|nr:hypothetical protein [Oligoflexus sp.]HET9238934.1 hypothetical protein [Oligoflexus sp.]
MLRSLISILALILIPTACVSTGKLDSQGFTHDKVGYSLPYAKANEKLFINSSWTLETNSQGQPSPKDNGIRRLEVKSYSGHEETMLVQDLDLVFKHRETNGVISVQSVPLGESAAYKKLPILAKDHMERLSGLYYASLVDGGSGVGKGKNYVTNIVEGKAGTIGTADTYEVVVDVANAEQLKLNPEHRLMRYKMVMIKPKAPEGWKDLRGVYGKKVKPNDRYIEETYPALIVLTYAMDHAFYQEYLADFEALVRRFKLRG